MKKTVILASALASALAIVLAGAAIAAPPAAGHSGIDANGDGAIDRAEAASRPRLAQRFEALDADKDGRLERGEWPKAGGPRRGRGARIDADRDGRITRAEAAAHPRFAARFDSLDGNRDGVLQPTERPVRKAGRAMSRIDADGDGRITRSEAAATPRLAARFAALDRNSDGAIDASERPRAGARGMRGRARVDIDRDGRISRAEAARHPRLNARFASLDADRDGALTRDELKQRRRVREATTPR